MPGSGLDESLHAIRRRFSESSDLPPNADRPLSVEKRESVFLVRTADGGCEAKNVEIATGLISLRKSRLSQSFSSNPWEPAHISAFCSDGLSEPRSYCDTPR